MKTIGTQIASAILSGDVPQARTLAIGMRSVSIPEGRAITRACEVANTRWGTSLSLAEFLSGR